MPWSVQVFGLQLVEPHLPLLQIWPLGQGPQSATPLQPSLVNPHSTPDGQPDGEQPTLPQRLACGG